MKQRIFLHLQIALTYIGAVIGAGFASGQELLQFFVIFGQQGLLGIALATICFAFLGMTILKFVYLKRINDYSQFLTILLGNRIGKLMDATVTFILFTSLIIMLSASGALFREQLQQSELLGIIVSSLVLLLSLKAGIAGLIKINSLLIPCLVIITCIVSVLAYFYPPSLYYPGDPLITNKFLIGGWAGAAILYVSYNILIAIVGLASLGSQVQQAKGSFGGFLGGLGVGCLAFIMGVAMMNFYPEILNYQIPMIFLAQYFHPVLKILETSALWIALLTTAAVDAYALATKIQKSSIFSYRFSLFGIIVFALPFSLMNFADLVSRVYPVLGYLGILIGSLILLRLVLRSKI